MSVSRISPAVTAWMLADPIGRPAKCLVSDRGSRWQLVIWNDDAIVLWERYKTSEQARHRAEELWSMLVKNGWQPADDPVPRAAARPDYFRRTCPECHEQTAVVTYRRHGYVVLFCDTCEHGWTDRERGAASGAHPSTLPHRERRRVA